MQGKTWRCRNGACDTALGIVLRGTMTLLGLTVVRSVDPYGVVQVVCPNCQRVKPWFPGRSPAAPRAVTEEI